MNGRLLFWHGLFVGHRVKDVTARVVRLQSGYLYHYAFVMLIGIALLLTWAITVGGLLQ